MDTLIPTHQPIHSNGQDYSLHHLQPRRHSVPGHGRDGVDLIVRVSFFSHVYSTDPVVDAVEALFEDERRRVRQFCTVRHDLSVALPQLCCDLIDRNQPTWRSIDKSHLNNLAVCDSPLLNGEKYVIYFDVHPSRADGVHVEMSVKSAYVKFVDFSRTGKRDTMRQILKRCHFQGVRVP